TRCSNVFEIRNPSPGSVVQPPPSGKSVNESGKGRIPGPDDFALDETALTEASKRKRQMPGAPARAMAMQDVLAASPLAGATAPDATAPPPTGSHPARTTDKVGIPESLAAERRLRLPTAFRYSLACISGPDAGKIFDISKPRVVIGRANADIVVADIQCSRQHAAIEVMDEHTFVVDLNSTNGTYVNDQRVNRAELDNRTEFEIGTTTLMLIRSFARESQSGNVS
ncbi:MAG: FHA domain-containing protein, partial [Thermoanaerobaculia bacterium]|nr:FHA domain-containing protein [Thermoanaerobaculia bacterium]